MKTKVNYLQLLDSKLPEEEAVLMAGHSDGQDDLDEYQRHN